MSRPVLAVALLVLLLVMGAARFHTYDEPLDMDPATYAVIAREMRSGDDLYTDLWDHKPPAIYASYYLAQSVAGHGALGVYLLGLTLAGVTLLGVYFATAQAAGAAVGLIAAAFWAIVSTDLNLQANQPNAEAFINACLIWAFGLVLRLPSDRLALDRTLAIGALIALASLYKHVAVTAIGLMAAHVIASRFTRASFVQAAVITIVVVAAWSGVTGYFAATQRLDAFVGAVFQYNRVYAGSVWDNIVTGSQGKWLIPPFTLQFWPLMLLAPLALGFSGGPVSTRAPLLLLTFSLATFLSVVLPGQFFAHYYQLWLPLICVSAAWGIAALQRMVARRWVLPFASLAAAALVISPQLQNFARSPLEWAAMKHGDRLLQSQHAADLINTLLLPAEKFFQWGNYVELYYYADRPPVGGELRSRHLLQGPQQPERIARLLRKLETERPELIIVVAGHDFPEHHRVPRWIMEHYKPLAAQPCDRPLAERFLFLTRRGGRVEGLRLGPCLSRAASD